MAGPPPKPWPTGQAEQLEPLVRRVLAPNPRPTPITGTETYIVGAEGRGRGDRSRPRRCRDTSPRWSQRSAMPRSRRSCAPTPTATIRPPRAPLAATTGAPIVGCAPLVLDDDGPRADAAFDRTYAPDRVLADGEAMTGPGWTLTRGRHPRPHLEPPVLRAGGKRRAVHRRSRDGLVDQRGRRRPMATWPPIWRASTKLHARDDRVYYPAHGPAIDKPRQLVRGMIGHRRQRESQIVRLLGEAARADRGRFGAADVQGARPAAVGRGRDESVLAHLIDLERRGMVARSGDNGQRS